MPSRTHQCHAGTSRQGHLWQPWAEPLFLVVSRSRREAAGGISRPAPQARTTGETIALGPGYSPSANSGMTSKTAPPRTVIPEFREAKYPAPRAEPLFLVVSWSRHEAAG